MKKGYSIAIGCLMAALLTMAAVIFFQYGGFSLLKNKDENTGPKTVTDLTPFKKALQDIEDSKTAGGYIPIRPEDKTLLFRYDQPFDFTAQILKEKKAACLYTTYKSDLITFTGYYELYYDKGWQVERVDGKPIMYVERVTYGYDETVGIYQDGDDFFVQVAAIHPDLDADKSTATVAVWYDGTLYSDIVCPFNLATGSMMVEGPRFRFPMTYNAETKSWESSAFPLTKTNAMPQ